MRLSLGSIGSLSLSEDEEDDHHRATGGHHSSSNSSSKRGRGGSAPAMTGDEAMSNIGFGRFHLRMVATTGCFWAIDSMQLLLMVFLPPILRCEWQLSLWQEASLVMAVFGAMAVGSLFWGNVADRTGRRIALLGICLVNIVAGLCSAMAPSYIFMLVSQCMVGFAVGGCYVSVALYGELLPPSRKGWQLASVAYGFALGGVVQTLLAVLVLPSYNWRVLVGLTSLLSLLPLLMCTCLPESPRFYIAAGHPERSRSILDHIAKVNGSVLRPGMLTTTAVVEDDVDMTEQLGRFGDLMHSAVRRFTAPLALVWLLLSAAYFWQLFLAGTLFTSSRLTEACTHDLAAANNGTSLAMSHMTSNCNGVSKEGLAEILAYSLAEIPGVALMTILLALLARRGSMVASLALAGATMFALLGCIGSVYSMIVLFVVRLFFAAGFQAMIIYTRDMYPTSCRCTAMGSFNAIGRLGGIVLPYLAWFLVDTSVSLSIIVAGAVFVLCGIAAFLLPVDSYPYLVGETLADASIATHAASAAPPATPPRGTVGKVLAAIRGSASAGGGSGGGSGSGGPGSAGPGSGIEMGNYSRVRQRADSWASDHDVEAKAAGAGSGAGGGRAGGGGGAGMIAGSGRPQHKGKQGSRKSKPGAKGGEEVPEHPMLAHVRKELEAAGPSPDPAVVWKLSQQVQTVASCGSLTLPQQQLDELTDECVKLRVLSRHLKRQASRNKSHRSSRGSSRGSGSGSGSGSRSNASERQSLV